MAKQRAALEVGIEFPELKQLRDQLMGLKKNIAAKHIGAALRVAMKPGLQALKSNTPKGPTGNLRKSIKLKIKTYPKQGNAVGIVGYETSKGSKGFHQYWLERGTKERKTKGRFASTAFSGTAERRGKGKFVPSRTPAKSTTFQIFTPGRGKYAGKLRTKPYPRSFFKSAKAGQVVSLGKMPIGGRTGVPPVKTSFNQAQPAMRSLLQQELATRLEKALNEVKGRVARGLIT
jgi:HK97 gp10 family phage protein